MSSNEVLEANVVAIRDNLNELKNDFRAAVARIDNDIKAAVTRLEAEIRAMAEKASRDLKELAVRVDEQLREMRTDDKALRERVDNLDRKFDSLDRKVERIDTKLTALLWVMGGLGTLVTIVVTVGKALRWF